MKKMIAMLLALSTAFSMNAFAEGSESERPFEGETLTVAYRLVGGMSGGFQAQLDAFEEKTGCNIEVEILAADADEAESVLLVRAATGNLPDVFATNVGAKLEELDPQENIMDLSGYEWINRVNEQFRTIVTDDETGAIYGIPSNYSNAAGFFYNKEVFANLNLSIPETWDEFLETCQVLRDNGIDPVEGVYSVANGRQFLFLAQYYYVQKANPTFAEDYTNRKIELHESPEYMRGLQKLYDMWENGYLNSDPLSTGPEEAVLAIAEGTAAMTFHTTGILATFEAAAPGSTERIGFFPLPDENADERGVALWMPHAWYISQNTEHEELAAALLEFLTTQEALDINCSIVPPSGAFLVDGVTASGDMPEAVQEAQQWANIAFVPAMEYFCPIKGSNMANIMSMVGTGQYTPEEAIAEIEADNAIDAQQKGIAGW